MKAAERLAERGEPVRRVVLEEELKREYQRFLQAENRERRERGETPEQRAEAVARWAHDHQLPYDDGHVQFPDARIEFDGRDGRRSVEDIELSRRTTGALTLRRRSGLDSHVTGHPGRGWEVCERQAGAVVESIPASLRSFCHDVCRARAGSGEEGVHGTPGRIPCHCDAALRRLCRPTVLRLRSHR